MHSPATYEEWDSSPARWIERSYLYSLAPIGRGTSTVESFTGYIARLAAAHAVEHRSAHQTRAVRASAMHEGQVGGMQSEAARRFILCRCLRLEWFGRADTPLGFVA